LLLVFFSLPESVTRARVPLDIIGGIGMGAWLSCLIIAVNQSSAWGRTSAKTLGFLAAALVIFGLWLLHEKTHKAPLVPLKILGNRRLLPVFLSASTMSFGALSCYIGITQFAQVPEALGGYGFGATVLGSGAILLPLGVVEASLALATGSMVNRYGAKPVMIFGLACMAASFVLWATVNGTIWSFLLGGTLFGLGLMPVFAAGFTVTITLAPRDSVGIAAGVQTMFFAIGSSLGIATLTAFTTNEFIPKTPISVLSGYEHLFWTSAGVCLFGILLALLIPKNTGYRAFDTQSA
jgi:MFS family permease